MPTRKNLHKVKRKYVVPDWKSAWRWWSVRIMSVMVGAQAAITIAPNLHQYIPESIWHPMMMVLGIAAILGRFANQGGE